jgi:hypothetical protein
MPTLSPDLTMVTFPGFRVRKDGKKLLELALMLQLLPFKKNGTAYSNGTKTLGYVESVSREY